MPKSTVLYCFLAFFDSYLLAIFLILVQNQTRLLLQIQKDQNFCILESFATSH